MTNDGSRALHFDPIVDGNPPHMDRVMLALCGLLAASALWNAHAGDYWGALDSVVVIALVVVYERLRRRAYFRGYRAAVGSVREQFEEYGVLDDD